MIKYADRGLVNNGSVSPLFETLYLIVFLTLFSVFSVFTLLTYFLRQDPNKKSTYHQMCIKQSAESDFESMKSLAFLLALAFPFFIIFISMFISIFYFLRSRGTRGIGHYRRNILSLKETFIYAIFILILFIMHSTVLKFYNYFGFSVDGLRLFTFTHHLLVHQLFEGIIWPLYILWNLHETMPEFYSDEAESELKFHIVGQFNMDPNRLFTNKENLDQNIFVKVRSTGRLIKAEIKVRNNEAEINLEEDEIGISPGQACVFYSKNEIGDKVLGGGWIYKAVNNYLST